MDPIKSRLGNFLIIRKPPRSSSRLPKTSSTLRRNVQRFFSSNSHLKTLHRPSIRPQIPFLSESLQVPRNARLLSTSFLANVKYQIHLGFYWAVVGWVIMGGCYGAYHIFREDWLDKLHPSPKEWKFGLKHQWRKARHLEFWDGPESGTTDWTLIGAYYNRVVALIEIAGTKAKSSKTVIKVQDDWDRSIPGIDEELMRSPPEHFVKKDRPWPSRIGYDVSAKAERWCRCYYEAMMGLARSAEARNGYVGKTGTKLIYPPQYVRSESNPNPIPLGKGQNPDISECFPAFLPPEFYYIRILTTKGFSRKQRLDAGLAYGRYLEHIGNAQLAEQMFRWSLNLAADGVTEHDKENDSVSQFIDRTTGVMKPRAPFVTDNLIKTTTALASFLGRHGDEPTSLAIFLSILRAQRAAPVAQPLEQYEWKGPDYSLRTPGSWSKWVMDLPVRGEMPVLIPDGDEPLERKKANECEEAEIMMYVGEILFAKSGKKKQGLGWTREGTELAQRRANDHKLVREAMQACEQCTQTGLKNWLQMATSLAQEKKTTLESDKDRGTLTWIWNSAFRDKWVTDGEWEEEESMIKARLDEFQSQLLRIKLNKATKHNQSFWNYIFM